MPSKTYSHICLKLKIKLNKNERREKPEHSMLFDNKTMPFKQGVRSSNLRWSTSLKTGKSLKAQCFRAFLILLQISS